MYVAIFMITITKVTIIIIEAIRSLLLGEGLSAFLLLLNFIACVGRYVTKRIISLYILQRQCLR